MPKKDVCEKCGWWKPACHCGGTPTLRVDETLGYYDNQLDVYIESSSHRRQVEKRLGVEGMDTTYRSAKAQFDESRHKQEKERTDAKTKKIRSHVEECAKRYW